MTGVATIAQSLLAVLLLCSVAYGQAPGETERLPSAAPNCSPLSPAAARLEARKLLDDAEQATTRKSKARSLEAAYRLYQAPAMLYNLGMLWQGAGKRVEAADLLRRYLYEADNAVAAERRDRLSKLLARAPGSAQAAPQGEGRDGGKERRGRREQTGELELSGEPCSFVYVDGRLVGRMPLSLPLLLRTGPHVIDVEKDHRQRRVELTVEPGLRAHAVRLPSSAVLLGSGAAEAVLTAAEGALAEAGLTPIGQKAREATLAAAPQLRGCLGTLPCQEQLAQLLGAQYVLELQTTPERLSLRLLDADVGAWSAGRDEGCPGCAPGALSVRALELARDVLREGLGRGRGTLQVTSAPEADVVVDGRRVGRTPLLRSALAGVHSLALHAPGYLPHKVRVELEDGKRHVVDATLKADSAPAPAPAPPPVAVLAPRARPPVMAADGEGPRRPRARLAIGGVSAGLGAVLLGFGAAALSINGQCGPASVPAAALPCERRYETAVPGGVMVGVGAGLVVGGVIAMAWPAAERPRPPARAASARLAAPMTTPFLSGLGGAPRP